jgi:hypothetical protein
LSLIQLGAQKPPHDPRVLVNAILAQRRFHTNVPVRHVRTWWDALRDWIGDRWSQFSHLFAHRVNIAGAAPAIGDIALLAAVVVIVVLFARLLIRLHAYAPAAHSGATTLFHRLTADELAAQAEAAAEQGRYAHAIALLFRASLARLDAARVLRDDPARTVEECRRDVVAKAPRLRTSFDALAELFTAAVYAEQRSDAQSWTLMKGAYAALE